MIRQILGTLSSKVIVTGMTFFIVVLNTRMLGVEGQGNIALINLGISIAIAMNNFIGGGAVIYLAPREAILSLIKPAYLWALTVALLSWGLLEYLAVFDDDFAIHIAAIALLHALFLFNSQVLLGKMKVRVYNLLTLLQVASVLLTLLCFYFILNEKLLFNYLTALYASFGISFGISFFLIIPYFSETGAHSFRKGLQELWKYGKYNQTAYLSHLLNKRMSYIFLDAFKVVGRSGVGIFSIGTQLAEAIWIASSSLATVQYSHIANSENKESNIALTLLMTKASFLLGLIGMTFLLLLPEAIYLWVFGDEVIGIKSILIFLAPGVVAMTCNAILTHHFSGTGRHKVGTTAALIALVVMIGANFLLIPAMGMLGAAIATSLAFIVHTSYHAFVFSREDGVLIKDFLIDGNDLKRSAELIKKLIRKYQ